MPNVIEIHREMYRAPRFYAPSLGHGIYTSIFIALVAFSPSPLDAVWLTPVLPLANLTGTFSRGFIAPRIPASKLSIYGFVMAGVLLALLGLTGSITVALCALFATSVTAGANFGAVPEFNASP